MARSNSVAGRVLQLMPDQFEVQVGPYFKPLSADKGKAFTEHSGADKPSTQLQSQQLLGRVFLLVHGDIGLLQQFACFGRMAVA